MTISRKVLVGSLSLSAISVLLAAIITGILSFSISETEIEKQSQNSLIAQRETLRGFLNNYLSTIKKQIVTYSSSNQIKDAAKAFVREFDELSRDQASKPSKNDIDKALGAYYKNEYGARYAKRNPNMNLSALSLMDDASQAAQVMQYHFIGNNKNPLGEKDALTSLSFDSAYNDAHKLHHPDIRKYLQEFEYYDIFIIDAETGHIVYSVFKELDYATSLLTGPYRNSGLAEVFKGARDLQEDGTSFSAFKPYTPSYEDPASFIASPIKDENGKTIAVLAFQMPIDVINKIMTHDNHWEQNGLGLSGETYLVSQDFKAQSISRFLIEDAEGYVQALKDNGTDPALIETIQQKGTNIGYQTIKTKGVEAALTGEAGFDIFPDYRDVPVLSAYAPIEFEGSRMALMAEIDEAEAYAFKSELISSIVSAVIIIALVIVGIVAYISWTFSTSLRVRLDKAVSVANAVAKGDKVQIETSTTADEIDGLMTALDRMQTELIGEFERQAEETSRVTSALKVANTNLMMADNDFNIIYLNDTVQTMFKSAETDLRKELPNFSADNLIGQNIDVFHKQPSHQRQLLAGLSQRYENTVKVGGRTFTVVANPVMSDNGDRLGTVVEWIDQTEMLAKQEAERREAAENARLKQALDNVSANVMVADADRNIVYINKALQANFGAHEGQLQTAIPGFSVDSLTDSTIDQFHQFDIPKTFDTQIDAQEVIGSRTFHLVANPVKTASGDQIGSVLEWNDQTEAIAAREAELRIANENARIKEALDNVSANVMLADPDRNIIYTNKAVVNTLQNAEQAIKSVLPNFDANNLLGQSIDQFHKNPSHQQGIIEGLTGKHQASIEVGGRYMDLCVNTVNNDKGERIGTVVEWFDRTNEVHIQKEVDGIVNAARAGDLSQRVEIAGKDGFFKQLSEGLNDILDNTGVFISDMSKLFEEMAEGNLGQSLSSNYQGDFENIASNANATLSKLSSVLSEIMGIAHSVNESANEISQGSVDLSNRTESQASSLEETAASMEEITSTVKESEKNSDDATSEANDARTRAESGGQVVNQAVEAMKEISESSNKINDIIGVIDEIAFQTNLLALNAAVEAARAGEHGRGFAVVAGEVRTLSQRSASAAKEIKDLIRDSVNKVESGSLLVNQTGETLSGIVHSVEQVARRIESVNVAAKEQSNGIGQINQAISQMDEMTQQNAALVEETAAASRSMSDQASKMQQLVRFFRT